MNEVIHTGLPAVLARAEWVTETRDLAAAWIDQTLFMRLEGVGGVGADFGGHLRRSFLGALGVGASPAAQAGRPCTWDPPCALDVFYREQLRGPRGDGLAKPFVLAAWPEQNDLVVMLRVFGMAMDWSSAAFEALVAGIRGILPWPRLVHGMSAPPAITARSAFTDGIIETPAPEMVQLTMLSPVDASGADPFAEPHTILARAFRRVDAISRWNGVALETDKAIAVARQLRSLDYDLTGLVAGRYSSPNRHGQRRNDPTISGTLVVRGDLTDIWPVLRIAERAHIGRHAVEGLGRVRIDALDFNPGRGPD